MKGCPGRKKIGFQNRDYITDWKIWAEKEKWLAQVSQPL
jgi:hypothetical protein